MSWVNTIWTMSAAACLTLAAVHVVIWGKDRAAWVNLLFAVMAALVAVFGLFELLVMRAETPTEYAELYRWGHVPAGFLLVALLGFVRLYFGTGRPWLFWLVVGLRLLVLVLNFLSPASFHFSAITALRPFEFLGETVVVPEGVPTPWARLGEGSMLLALIFVADAAISLWRRGNARERRRAVFVGGSVLVCFGAAIVIAILSHTGLLRVPHCVSLFFGLMMLAMAYELGYDLIHAGELARDLRESEQRIDLAVTAANLGLWVWDPVRDDVWATPRARQMFGMEAVEQIDFNHFLQSLHPDDREPVTHAVANALNGDGEYEAEYRVVVPGRATSWIAARGRVEFNPQLKPVRLRGVLIDITERKRAEEKFRLAVQAAPTAIVMVDPQGKILLCNPLAETLFGYRPEELVGQSVEVLVPERLRGVHPGHRGGFMTQPQSRPMGAGRELFARRKDGSEVPVEIGLNPIQTGEGVLVLAAVTDITERRQAELEADQQRSELAHLSRVTTVSELASSLAHELNQPLAIILSNAQAAQRLLAQQPPEIAEVQDILTDIVSEDRRAGEVIQRLRSLLKRGETREQPLCMNEILDEVLRLLSSDLIGRGVKVHRALASCIPKVLGDRIQLQQVLLNIILNACDAMAANPPADRSLTLLTTHGNGAVRVSVSDTGCGLPPEVERVFAPFYTTKKQGLGLGLPICRTIVTAHKGRLWAEASVAADKTNVTNPSNHGATFHLELPAAPDGKL